MNNRVPAIGLNLFWQPVLMAVYIAAMIFLFRFFKVSKIDWAVGVGALSSSAFIVLASPMKISARGKSMLLGYAIAIIFSIIVHFVKLNADLVLHLTQLEVNEFWLAIVLAITTILMSVWRIYHPPAAGLSMVLVVDTYSLTTVYIITTGVLVLVGLKFLLRHNLKELFSVAG
jgi:hypothetical protein